MKSTLLILLIVSTRLNLVAGDESGTDYVAHEWGTFTSVQGADGSLIEWTPIETAPLPRFVYNWGRPGLNRLPTGGLNPSLKSRFITLQRMETPVIYFYSDQERTVDVAVRFPQGLITDWYPQAHDIGPSAFPPNRLATAFDGLARNAGADLPVTFASIFGRKGVPDSRIVWKQVRVLPAAQYPRIADQIPAQTSGNHYFAARETGAAFVRVTAPGGSGPATEHEKYLFYRGVGNFKTPLCVSLNNGNEADLVLANTSTRELRHLFVLEVRHGRGQFVYQENVPPGQRASVGLAPRQTWRPLDELVKGISDKLSRVLMEEGLYEAEALAMVKTWRDSWFEEEGLRVLYLLPRPWTDEVLPLTLDPQPRDLVRTMVGRAEIITPGTEWELLKQIVLFADGDPDARRQTIGNVRRLGLGRFIEPAVRRILGSHPSREFSQAGWEVISAVTGSRSTDPSIALQQTW